MATDARAMLLDLVHNSFISVQWDGPDGQKRNLQGCTFYRIAHRTRLHPWMLFSSSSRSGVADIGSWGIEEHMIGEVHSWVC